MISKKLPQKLPKFLHQYFWDVDAVKVNPSKYPECVINRLLDKGDLKAARWTLKTFPKALIKDTFKTMRDFSPRNSTFWTLFLKIPRKETVCLQKPYLKRRRMHWPY